MYPYQYGNTHLNLPHFFFTYSILACIHGTLLYRYGGERYEKREMQLRVRQRFAELQAQEEQSGEVAWHVVNAAQTVENVQQEINRIVQKTIDSLQNQPTDEDNNQKDMSSASYPVIKRLWKNIN